MSAIKKFFEKKKLDMKFKQAGQGHKLNEQSSTKTRPEKDPSSSRVRLPSETNAKAAEAAIARFGSAEKQKKKPISSTTTWKAQASSSKDSDSSTAQQLKSAVYQEIRNEYESTRTYSQRQPSSEKTDDQFQNAPYSSCIVFSCPVCPVCLPEREIKSHIKQCLYREIDAEPGMIAASIIHTCNEREKVRHGLDTLNKYLDNIINYPNEAKYRKIKQNNKIFKERVAPLEGVKELLTLGAGFVEVKMAMAENLDEEENYYVLSEGLAMETEKLAILKTYLNEAEPLEASLDRNMKVFEPAISTLQPHVPDDFYCLSTEELKKEQRSKISVVEKNKQLRTKAMRDAEDSAPKRCYRFTLIRIRFPDGNILEGTFYSSELFMEVQKFVKDSIEFDWLPFDLYDASGKQLTGFDKSLEYLDLSPAAILYFRWDPSAVSDVRSSDGKEYQYLTDELLARKIPLS